MFFPFVFVLLFCHAQLSQSEMLSRYSCFAFAFCGDQSNFDYAKYTKPEQTEENGSKQYYYEVNTRIIDYTCEYVLKMSACIQKSNYTSVCEKEVVDIFNAFIGLVGNGCGSYKTDMIDVLTCLNDKDIQISFAECASKITKSFSMQENCGFVIDTILDECMTELRICNPTAVSRMETFIQGSKDDFCFLTTL